MQSALTTSASAPAAAEETVALPLVSVLIRSTDREYLPEALASVAAQSYPNIEVVVVGALPGHASLPSRCGRFELRLVTTETALARSQAANVALDNARGDYLLFLDDDDWLLPSHIERLAAVLTAQPRALVAYTGIALVDRAGQPLSQTLDLPFDGVRQLAGNLTPIHAVLFARSLVERGCRFDEALDRYEDWDFWLQIAQHTTFCHLPGVSAVYRIHESSGVHVDAGPLGAASQLIYDKWRKHWQDKQLGPLMERVWACAELEFRLAGTDAALATANQSVAMQGQAAMQHAAVIAQQTHVIAEQGRTVEQLSRSLAEQVHATDRQASQLAHQGEEVHLLRMAVHERDLMRERDAAAFRNSASWRVTAPLRWAAGRLRPNRPAADPNGEPRRQRPAVRELAEKALRYQRVHGTKGLVRAVVRRLRQRGPAPAPAAGVAPNTTPATEQLIRADTPVSATVLARSRFPGCAPLRLFTIPRPATDRVNLLIDSLGDQASRGGADIAVAVAATLALARAARLRIITRTDKVPPSLVSTLLELHGIALPHGVDFAHAPAEGTDELDTFDGELFVTTSWWTTEAAAARVPETQVVYLVLEDERLSYPHGDAHMRCTQVLQNDRIGFAVNGKGLFDELVKDGLAHIARRGAWFEPALPAAWRAQRRKATATKRQLVLCVRPQDEPELAYLGADAIETAIARGIIDLAQWDIALVGPAMPDLRFANGRYAPRHHGPLDSSQGASAAGSADLGLCLLYTAHPHYPPLDLADAGAVVVSNHLMAGPQPDRRSTAIILADLDAEALCKALAEGARRLAEAPESGTELAPAEVRTADWRHALAGLVDGFGMPLSSQREAATAHAIG